MDLSEQLAESSGRQPVAQSLPIGTFVQNISLSSHDLKDECPQASVSAVSIDELAHELRQPLGAIESLAYYLEMTSPDDSLCQHLEQIRDMVNRASLILDRASTANETPRF